MDGVPHYKLCCGRVGKYKSSQMGKTCTLSMSKKLVVEEEIS